MSSKIGQRVINARKEEGVQQEEKDEAQKWSERLLVDFRSLLKKFGEPALDVEGTLRLGFGGILAGAIANLPDSLGGSSKHSIAGTAIKATLPLPGEDEDYEVVVYGRPNLVAIHVEGQPLLLLSDHLEKGVFLTLSGRTLNKADSDAYYDLLGELTNHLEAEPSLAETAEE